MKPCGAGSYVARRFFSLLAAVVFLAAICCVFVHTGPARPTPRVIEYRATRIAIAVLVGLILGGSGSLLQSALRNPLVDHYLLGVGGGAVFAVYLYYLLSGPPSPYTLSVVAAAGGLLALAATLMVAEAVGGSSASYILAGIGVTSLFSGASVTVSYLVISRHPAAYHLLLGSLVYAVPKWIPVLSAATVVVAAAYAVLAKPLNALLLGDVFAAQLGYDPRRTRLAAVIVAGAASSVTVACCGLIGFIGLAAPHIARLAMGTSDNRWVAPLSMLLGASLLVAADNFSRVYLVSVTGEVPAGAISSSIGAVFYILILTRRLGRRGRL